MRFSSLVTSKAPAINSESKLFLYRPQGPTSTIQTHGADCPGTHRPIREVDLSEASLPELSHYDTLTP